VVSGAGVLFESQGNPAGAVGDRLVAILSANHARLQRGSTAFLYGQRMNHSARPSWGNGWNRR
jgi:hypothetical protein